MANEAFSCASYEPGHNVHQIQAQVKAHLPRFWAKVDLIGPKAVRVVATPTAMISVFANEKTMSPGNTAVIKL